jgi:DNA-binding MarR family transcriptional regulator
MASREDIQVQDYQSLSEFRYHIRKFLRASEQILRTAGLKPQQYQLLLAIKGLPDGSLGTIGELAERLQIQHHSTVELVDRLSTRGLVKRRRAGDDRRQVLVELTPKGEKLIREMALYHREELRVNGPGLVGSLKKVLAGIPRNNSR